MQEPNSSVESLSSQPDFRKSVIPRLTQGRVRGNLSSFPRTREEARKRLKRAKAKQRRSRPPPTGVQGAALSLPLYSGEG